MSFTLANDESQTSLSSFATANEDCGCLEDISMQCRQTERLTRKYEQLCFKLKQVLLSESLSKLEYGIKHLNGCHSLKAKQLTKKIQEHCMTKGVSLPWAPTKEIFVQSASKEEKLKNATSNDQLQNPEKEPEEGREQSTVNRRKLWDKSGQSSTSPTHLQALKLASPRCANNLTEKQCTKIFSWTSSQVSPSTTALDLKRDEESPSPTSLQCPRTSLRKNASPSQFVLCANEENLQRRISHQQIPKNSSPPSCQTIGEDEIVQNDSDETQIILLPSQNKILHGASQQILNVDGENDNNNNRPNEKVDLRETKKRKINGQTIANGCKSKTKLEMPINKIVQAESENILPSKGDSLTVLPMVMRKINGKLVAVAPPNSVPRPTKWDECKKPKPLPRQKNNSVKKKNQTR